MIVSAAMIIAAIFGAFHLMEDSHHAAEPHAVTDETAEVRAPKPSPMPTETNLQQTTRRRSRRQDNPPAARMKLRPPIRL